METDFLMSSFPEIAQERIRGVLESAENNIQGAVDVLLNEVLLRELGIESEEEQDRDARQERRHPRRSGRAQRQRVLFSNNKSVSAKGTARQNHHGQLQENVWSDINVQAEQLAEILDIRPSQAASAVHCDKVWELVVENARNRRQEESDDLDTAAIELACEFPNLGSDCVYTLLHATGGNLETASILQHVLAATTNGESKTSGKGEEEQRQMISPGVKRTRAKGSSSSKGPEEEFVQVERRKGKSGTKNKTDKEAQLNSGGSSTVKEEDAYDQDYYAARELRLREQRNSAFGAAAQFYRQGQFAIAGSYAERARAYERERHTYALGAARAAVHSTGTGTHIDLHNLPVAEAIEVAMEHVDAWFCAQTTPRPPLVIVTGAGVHSVRGMPRIRPALERALRTHGWAYTRDSPGAIAVRGRVVP